MLQSIVLGVGFIVKQLYARYAMSSKVVSEWVQTWCRYVEQHSKYQKKCSNIIGEHQGKSEACINKKKRSACMYTVLSRAAYSRLLHFLEVSEEQVRIVVASNTTEAHTSQSVAVKLCEKLFLNFDRACTSLVDWREDRELTGKCSRSFAMTNKQNTTFNT